MPKVEISVSPQTMPSPGMVTIDATATDDDGTIAKVTFYEGSTKLGDVMTAPYSWQYNAATANKLYKFRAVATDDKGGTGSSVEAGVTVGSLVNAAPKVTLTTNPTSQTAPGMLTLTASPSDDDGTIAKVEFYVGGTKIGEKTASPWTQTYTTTQNVIYKFTARATDDKGATGTSAEIPVSVGSATNIAPKVTLSVSNTQIAVAGLGHALRDRVGRRRHDRARQLLPERQQARRRDDARRTPTPTTRRSRAPTSSRRPRSTTRTRRPRPPRPTCCRAPRRSAARSPGSR